MIARSRLKLCAAIAAALASSAALSQGLIVYPARGQNAQQQQQDEGDCYIWARNRTGIDPTRQPAPVAYTQSSEPTGDVARGAVRGAVGGAVIASAAGGDSGDGAAVGMLIGGVRGAARKQQRQQQAAQQQQQAAQQQQAGTMQAFNNAMAACLEGRGYTVK